jgi:ribosome-binding factor A
MGKKRSSKSIKLKDDYSRAKIYISKPFRLKVDPEKISKVEITFTNLDTSKDSYEARVFINNTSASHNTATSERNGYVGSLYVFGHGSSCFGGPGHCSVQERDSMYDIRSSSPLSKCDHYLDVTESIRKFIKKSEIVVTIVPILAKIEEMTDIVNVLKIDGLSISIQTR